MYPLHNYSLLKLKERLRERTYNYLVVGRDTFYFVGKKKKKKKKIHLILPICSLKMIDLLCFVDAFFNRQSAYIWVDSNCAPLFADLFLYLHKTYFTHRFLKKNEKKLAQSFNFTIHHIDNVLPLNNSTF